MDFHGIDYSLFDYSGLIPDPESMIIDRRYWEEEERDLLRLSDSLLKSTKMRSSSPPTSRHDGTSPLPLGMDCSPPPRCWDGPNTIWPYDDRAKWRYCVTIPSWSILFEPGSSKPVVFYRVQVGLQSPQKITTTREVLRRFSHFLKLSSELKQTFSRKILPPAPPKDRLSMKNGPHVEKVRYFGMRFMKFCFDNEEVLVGFVAFVVLTYTDPSQRRRALQDWMAEVLSDIDISRSAAIACFLELEAAARLSFQEHSDAEPSANLDSSTGHSSGAASSILDDSVLAEASNSHINNDIASTDVSGIASPATHLAEEPVTETFYESDGNASEPTPHGVTDLDEAHAVSSHSFSLGDREAQSKEAVNVRENEAMQQELGFTRKKLESLQKRHAQAALKSKADIKLLVKEIKALRSSEMELQQQLNTERAEFERRLAEERMEKERLCAANLKLLQECESLRLRLEGRTSTVDDAHPQ